MKLFYRCQLHWDRLCIMADGSLKTHIAYQLPQELHSKTLKIYEPIFHYRKRPRKLPTSVEESVKDK